MTHYNERVSDSTISEICALLGETDAKARWTIERIVSVLGEQRARELAAEALAAKDDPVTAVREDGHARTAGGMFFKLVKDRCDTPTRLRIFYPWRLKDRKAYAEPSRPALSWEARLPLLAKASLRPGVLRNMKVTLSGRPDSVVQQPDFVMLAMRNNAHPALPRGLPAPPAAQALVTVYVTRKHWGAVSAALASDPGDFLIVEGYALYDEAIKGLAVFATKVLTRNQTRSGDRER